VEVDVPLGRLRLEVWSLVAQSQSHFRLLFLNSDQV
jgi:hypothetical protein